MEIDIQNSKFWNADCLIERLNFAAVPSENYVQIKFIRWLKYLSLNNSYHEGAMTESIILLSINSALY